AICPECSAVVELHRSDSMRSYSLHGECPRKCGSLQFGRHDDPMKDHFRKWTDAELTAIVNKHFARQAARCPVDGARVDTKPVSAGTFIHANCPRCGEDAQEPVAK